jgi:hypothetical protein
MRTSRRRRHLVVAAVLILPLIGLGIALHVSGWSTPLRGAVVGKKVIEDRMAQYGPASRARWWPHFVRAGVAYPPPRVTLAAFKREKRLEMYASDAANRPRFIRAMPILAASGIEGPKLRRGDGQVPEGIYPIESLNPMSRFHLALRVGYPNAFDREIAAAENRTDVGSDIMIHGGSASIGCLAMGDEAAEDLFVLAADIGVSNITLIIAPTDLRRHQLPPTVEKSPPWLAQLNARVEAELANLPADPDAPQDAHRP